MKSSRKPDLFVWLAIFVFIGVIASTLSFNKRDATVIQEQSATVPIGESEEDSTKSNYGTSAPSETRTIAL